MTASKFSFDYAPLSRGPSFALLLLVLCAIASSLSILANIVGENEPGAATRCSCPALTTAKPPASARASPKHQSNRAGAPTCHPDDTHEVEWDIGREEWMGWNSNVTEKWRKMLPDNNGLGQDDSFHDGIPYGIAMFHQIHCLLAIREHYTTLLGGAGVSQEQIDLVQTEGEMTHMSHCFEWIRQVLYLSLFLFGDTYTRLRLYCVTQTIHAKHKFTRRRGAC
jgi:Mycotoxin biosynthesis protein UstYa